MNLTNLQTTLEEAISRHQVAGASVEVFYENTLTSAAAGVINVNTSVDVTTDTVMHIGSIAKIFTTTLIMQLVDEGRIGLDDRVIEHVPQLKSGANAAFERITVKMLLNHSSGIDGEMLLDQGHDEETLEKGIARFAELGQIHEPGAGSSYCNAAMCIAGYLVQRITGTSWYDLIKQKIYAPLGMQHAVTLPEEALLYRAGVGHHLDPETNVLKRTSFCLLPLSFAPGGTTLMMSAEDLVTFTRAHLADGRGANGTRILSAQSAVAMREMTSESLKLSQVQGFGLGWMLFDNGVVGHGGGAPGVVSMLYACPEKQFAAAILTNAEHGMGLINDFMVPWLEEVATVLPYGIPVERPAPTGKVNIDPARYVGVFENITDRYKISALPEGLGLSVQSKFKFYDTTITDATAVAPLIALGNDTFVLPATGTQSAVNSSSNPQHFSFIHLDTAGHMQHLATGVRLYRRAI